SQYPARPHHFNSKYDTLLALMTNPMLPARRVSLVKGLRETVEVGQKCFDLDDSFLVQFTRYPHPKWEFHYDDGEHRLRIERTIILSSTENALTVRYRLNEGNTPTSMIVKCLVEYRSMHDQVRAGQNDGLRQAWEQACRVLDQSAGYIFAPGGQAQLQVVVPQGEYIHQPHWMYNLNFPLDAERGLEDHGDAFAPGVFRLHLSPGKSNTLVMTTGTNTTRISTSVLENEWAARRKDLFSKIKNPATNSNTYVRMLALALDQFIVQTPGGYRLLGGYPWLPMCSAGALQCAGGLLTAGRGEVVKDVILAIARTEQQGLIEDMPGESPARGQLEPSLRLYMAAADYVGETGDETLWDTPVGDGRTLREVLVDIFEHLTGGIMPSGVRVDEKTGLLYCPAGFSWMNTTYPQATPREGYPVEIQALWSEVLPILARLFPPYAEQALELRGRLDRHFLERFWRDRRGWLADVLLAGPGTPASQGLPDMALRFNQLAAIQAGMVSIEQARQIVDIISERLLIPGAVRSLSEDPLAVPRTILDSQGKLLADPHRPYQGRCEGDETRRRTAYHNGTAWLWAYPAFIESRAVAYGYSSTAVRQALAYFEPLWSDLTHSGIGTLGEMKDGDTPHRSRGCNAYAVSVAEALRVYSQLRYPNNHNGRIF
ncbi:MAG: glycogen debranching enzyme family protein, partial [Sedimentisphaerales bacterium]|nr:glycogen debranching enzyme family protein [Sedimentisphaerales bacterium]